MAHALEIVQIALCLTMTLGLVVGIPVGLYFGCPPAGVPFKGYYAKHHN